MSDDIDLTRLNPARMYDYYLGGAHNFAPDRELAEQALAVMPWMREAVRANRGFLRRAVAACAREGIDQFVDLGSGIPTAGATHEVARALVPHARVVYVDNEPVAYSHTRLMLAENPEAHVVNVDLTDPTAVLDGYRAALAPGSALLFSHATGDHDPEHVGFYAAMARPRHDRP